MPSSRPPITIATRGSALALAQAQLVLAQCHATFPGFSFEIKVIKTTGDKLQAVSLQASDLPKGLFTKELEVALLEGQADLAVHSLKDLPTQLPEGLTLGAVLPRADVRDVLIYRSSESAAELGQAKRGFSAGMEIEGLPPGAVVATSSTRRTAQLLERRPDLKVLPIRGNVPTRLRKIAEQGELDAIILAAAGLARLQLEITPEGELKQTAPFLSEKVNIPSGLRAVILPLQLMLPCVGQGAIGIETRQGDQRMALLCVKLNHFATGCCVAAERAFLRAMGGGCQLAVAAHAEFENDLLHLRAVSYLSRTPRRGAVHGLPEHAEHLGKSLAGELQI